MRKLLALVIVLLLLAALDVAARLYAQAKIEDTVEEEARGTASATAQIDAVPFLPRVLAGAALRKADVHIRQVPLRSVVVTSVGIELRDVEVDPASVIRGDPKVRDISGGTLTLELDGPALSRALNVPVSISNGRVRATVGGAAVTVQVSSTAGSLALRAGAVALQVSVPRSGLLACEASSAAVVGDRIRLTCQFREVPPALAD